MNVVIRVHAPTAMSVRVFAGKNATTDVSDDLNQSI